MFAILCRGRQRWNIESNFAIHLCIRVVKNATRCVTHHKDVFVCGRLDNIKVFMYMRCVCVLCVFLYVCACVLVFACPFQV